MSTVLRGSDNFDSASPSPTTHGAVGTYTVAYLAAQNTFVRGSTYSGSALIRSNGSSGITHDFERGMSSNYTNAGLSGTWRAMSTSYGGEANFLTPSALLVRIS